MKIRNILRINQKQKQAEEYCRRKVLLDKKIKSLKSDTRA